MKVDNDLYVRDYAKCILCYQCVDACGEQWPGCNGGVVEEAVAAVEVGGGVVPGMGGATGSAEGEVVVSGIGSDGVCSCAPAIAGAITFIPYVGALIGGALLFPLLKAMRRRLAQ